jgi:multidrug efflux pump subunit AcrB
VNFNVSAWSIRNPVPSILLFIVLCLLGITSFMRLPITQFPNIDVPVIAVSVTQSGAAPAELESQVTKRIEDSVSAITGVKHIVSTMSDGNSQTVIEFRLEVPTDKALDDVKDAVSKVRADLPSGVDEPIIQRIDVEGQAIQTYTASAPAKTLEELSWYVDDVVKRELQGLTGVGRVERYGGVDREIRVDLDPARLQALGVTAADVNRQLNATNTDLGSGRGEIGGKEQAIRTLGGARSLQQLKDTRIALPGDRQARLGDLAKITDSTEEARSFARYNGQPVVTFSIFRAKGASATEAGDRVASKIAELSKRDPSVSYTLVDDTVYFIYGNYKAAMATLFEGALLAVLVVLIFLRDWRATLIAAIALPLSAIPAFWAMSVMGFSLNLVSFLGITLATGILVDDAIVEIENIARHMKMGKSPYRAALEAADEIGLAVIAITFTIIAVFVPVSFMGGVVGQYFKQFGLTVAAAVAFSLLVARLITPMMAAYLMRDHKHREIPHGFLMNGYVKLLQALNWGPRIGKRRPRIMSYVTIAMSGLVLYGSILLIPLLPTGFIPRGDESRFVLSVELPPGTRLEDTLVTTEKIASIARENDEVSHVFVLGGSSPTGSLEPRFASVFVNLKHRDTSTLQGMLNPLIGWMNTTLGLSIPKVPKHGRVKPQWDIEDEILPKLSSIPDVRWAKITDRGGREIEFNMLSNDPKALDEAVGRLEVALRSEPILRSPSAQGGLDRPEIKIKPKTDEAARLGITAQQISEAVRVAMIGDFGPALAKFNAGDRLLPIRVQIPEESRANWSEIVNLRLSANTGQSVPLSSVADIEFSRGPSSIKRYDRQRQATIGSDIVPGKELGDASARILEVAKGLKLPTSVKIAEGGDAEIQGEVNTEFVKAMSLGVVLMLAVLVLLLGNIFQPFAIILSLPLSIGGVVLALLATNSAFSMPVTIGMLMLIGIVAKNAIMLIDFAVERVKHGMDRMDAIIDAGRKRARPIVMTTIAMAAGMLPSAYGIGEGGTFRSPMAIAVIGGLIASTFLSLVFVPSFYLVMDDLATLSHWVFARFVGETDEPPLVNEELEQVKRELKDTQKDMDRLSEKLVTVHETMAEVTATSVKKRKLNLAAE